MVRGSWVYDRDESLGSHVHSSLSKTYERAIAEISVHVRTALEPMDDVKIQDVQLTQPSEGIAEILVGYFIVEPPGEVIEDTPESEIAVQIPVEG